MPLVFGTSGHVDHGKSELVKALTGRDTARFPEERERGITIDIGFAFFDTGNLLRERYISIVDVPGHEKFVRNMLAGAAGLDAVLFVIALDEGIKQQTEEHLEILKLLDIRHGIVVLTKKDLVDDELVELVMLEVEEFLKGSFLENARMIPVSAKTGEGIELLKEEIKKLAVSMQCERTTGPTRMPVDRCFSLPGIGVILTGTLEGGEIKKGQNLLMLPSSKMVRVRTIHFNNREVESIHPRARVAVNISGPEAGPCRRGEMLVEPGFFETTTEFDARIKLLSYHEHGLKHAQMVRIYLKTAMSEARVRLLDRNALLPGEETFARFFLKTPLVAIRGDRFVIRAPGDDFTLGGGLVMDAYPVRKHMSRNVHFRRLEYLSGLREDELLVDYFLENRTAVTAVDCARLLGTSLTHALKLIERYVRDGRLTVINFQTKKSECGSNPPSQTEEKKSVGQMETWTDGIIEAADRKEPSELKYITTKCLNEKKMKALELIAGFHKANPLLEGINAGELKQKLGVEDDDLFKYIISSLKAEKKVGAKGPILYLSTFNVILSSDEESLGQKLVRQIESSGFTPPVTGVLAKENGAAEGAIHKLLSVYVAQGRLVKIAPDMYLARSWLDRAFEIIRKHIESQGSISIAGFRDATGINRKHALAILEYADNTGFTIRKGDVRVLRQK